MHPNRRHDITNLDAVGPALVAATWIGALTWVTGPTAAIVAGGAAIAACAVTAREAVRSRRMRGEPATTVATHLDRIASELLAAAGLDDVTVTAGNVGGRTLAEVNPWTRRLYLDPTLTNYPDRSVAAILTHEIHHLREPRLTIAMWQWRSVQRALRWATIAAVGAAAAAGSTAAVAATVAIWAAWAFSATTWQAATRRAAERRADAAAVDAGYGPTLAGILAATEGSGTHLTRLGRLLEEHPSTDTRIVALTT